LETLIAPLKTQAQAQLTAKQDEMTSKNVKETLANMIG
jgi:hypothetical protein